MRSNPMMQKRIDRVAKHSFQENIAYTADWQLFPCLYRGRYNEASECLQLIRNSQMWSIFSVATNDIDYNNEMNSTCERRKHSHDHCSCLPLQYRVWTLM